MQKKYPNLSRTGRKPGALGRTPRLVREAISRFVEVNMDGAQALYDRVARKNPSLALEILARFSELVLPKNVSLDAEVKAIPPPTLGISFEDGGPGRVRRVPYVIEVNPHDIDPALATVTVDQPAPGEVTATVEPTVSNTTHEPSVWERLRGTQ